MADGERPRRPTPEYEDAPKDPENYVRLRLDVPGLKKKRLASVPINATVTLEAKELSLKVNINLHENVTPNKYEYCVKQLPDPIITDPDQTFWKVKRNEEVVVMIRKANPRRWNTELQMKGLDVAPDS